jgi:tellurite methyltransferase
MAKHDYESVYSSSEDYYWGVNPSEMCLKIISLMPPEKHLKLLDICCGEGKDAVFLARCGYNVSAFDISDAGLDKVKRLAEKANVHVNVFKANIRDYRLDSEYDILYSSGALHYIKPELQNEIIDNYQKHTHINGLNAFNVFVEKPFIAPPPEYEEHSYFWQSGQLLTYYHDWFIEDFSEFVFDCNSSGRLHRHAMNLLFARKEQEN